MRKLFLLLLVLVLILSVMGCGSSSPAIVNLIDYPVHTGSSGDDLSRAFYITAYPGTTLSRVTLYLSATTADSYTVQLQALDSSYTGTLINTASASFSGSTGSSDFKTVTFNFNNVSVTKGNVIAFIFGTVSGGSGTVYFANHGDWSGASPIVIETADTSTTSNRWGWQANAIKVEGQN